MEFKSKRKYTRFFLFAIALHLIVLGFWFFFPDNILKNAEGKQTLTLLLLVNSELLLIFYIGLFKKKYYAFHDKIMIKRSLLKPIYISYNDITKIKERKKDSILLGFGTRPSFTIYYNKRKKTIRSDNNELFLKVIGNEREISNKK